MCKDCGCGLPGEKPVGISTHPHTTTTITLTTTLMITVIRTENRATLTNTPKTSSIGGLWR
jgi:hypothetical protein